MRKNRWLLPGLLLACIVGVVLVVLALLPPSPGITKENLDRVEVGMTRAEVEEILGGPANAMYPWGNTFVLNSNEWENDSSGDSAIIRFDKQDCVASKQWLGLADERTIWQKMLDRMPWREKPPPRPRPVFIRNY